MADKLITFEENGNIKASEINYNYEVLQTELTERLTAFDEYLKNEVDKAKGNFVLPGMVIGTPRVEAPFGYLLCDGSSYLRADYPDLFDAIKDTYGADDDYHFNVPDFRGMFLRGAGGENSASLGIVQECAVPNITGQIKFSGTDPATLKASASGAFTVTRSSGSGNGHDTSKGSATATFYLDANTISDVYKDDVTEVRPINQSINWVIKY